MEDMKANLNSWLPSLKKTPTKNDPNIETNYEATKIR